jgi:hypothetical protein
MSYVNPNAPGGLTQERTMGSAETKGKNAMIPSSSTEVSIREVSEVKECECEFVSVNLYLWSYVQRVWSSSPRADLASSTSAVPSRR